MAVSTQSVEPQIANLANGWLKDYGLDYKLEQESIGNSEIDSALENYFSKNGGVGGNRPDAKLLLNDKWGDCYPILIEYKGYKDKLEKLDSNKQVANKTSKNEPDFKNINSYALNGAVHYANAILHYTNYDNIISIGMSGYKDNFGNLQHEIAVYLVSKSNFGVGQKIGDFSDFSFLRKENFDSFIEQVKALDLSDEQKAQIKEKLELEISTSLTKLNNDIYKDESGLGENDRVYLVTASIIATLGIPGVVKPLDKNELKCLNEDGNRDGDILMRKVKAFLKEKAIPDDKKALVTRTLENTILSENLNKVINGQTQLKRVFSKIVDDLGIYYKTDLSTDFTGKLFNEMYGWLGFSQDKLNDVVLTPSYVATLLARLARVDKDSFVWDFATGSAGLLVAAMNEMINSAKNEIKSLDELKVKIATIKAKQLLGLEILPSIYMLAILNMILMGDGSSNILNKDSLNDFSGNYGFGENNGVEFPATAFILNPPYSAAGCGMVFVQKALSMMKKGYAAIIIQGSAGTGEGKGKGKGNTKAKVFNKEILTHSTLLASIKMPIDLFIGKSSVQTYIYVFRVGEKHNKDDIVKFIDFSNDGYSRSGKKTAKAEIKLRDTGDAKARYDELVNLVRFGSSKLNIFTDKEYYEGTIDPNSGSDWNKCAPIDTKPTLNDFKKCVSDFLSWEVANIIKNDQDEQKDLPSSKRLESTNWGEFKIGDLFEKIQTKKLPYKTSDLPNCPSIDYDLPALTAGVENQGLNNYVPRNNATILKNVISISANGANTGVTFYQNSEFTVLQDAYAIKWIFNNNSLSDNQFLFLTSAIRKAIYGNYDWSNKAGWEKIKNDKISLPITQKGDIDFDFMENFMREIEESRVRKIKEYLKATGLADISLTQAEQKAIGGGYELNSRIWQEFKIGDLFDVENTWIYGKNKQYSTIFKENVKNSIPVISGITINNGVNYYTTDTLEDNEVFSDCLTISTRGEYSGTVTYHKGKFALANNILTMPLNDKWSEKSKLFFAALINNLGYGGYSGYPRKETLKNDIIQLPITQNGEIDFDFMENFIKAISKECIKGVNTYLKAKAI